MKKITVFVIGFFILVFAGNSQNSQNKVVLANGKTIVTGFFSIGTDSISLVEDNILITHNKKDVLCIVPEFGKPFTFLRKNNIKTKIKTKDMKEDYQGTDIPRLYAY